MTPIELQYTVSCLVPAIPGAAEAVRRIRRGAGRSGRVADASTSTGGTHMDEGYRDAFLGAVETGGAVGLFEMESVG